MIGSYERIAMRLLKGQPRPKPVGRQIHGHFATGHQTLHRTRQSRTWRLFWRLKGVRP